MPARYIPALIIVAILLGCVIYAYQFESSYIKGMKQTSGMVAKLGSRSTSTITINGETTTSNTQALVDFQVNNTTYRVEGRAMGIPRWDIGQTVVVLFSEADPSRARIQRWDEIYFYTLICSFFLACCVFFGALNFIVYKVRGKPLS